MVHYAHIKYFFILIRCYTVLIVGGSQESLQSFQMSYFSTFYVELSPANSFHDEGMGQRWENGRCVLTSLFVNIWPPVSKPMKFIIKSSIKEMHSILSWKEKRHKLNLFMEVKKRGNNEKFKLCSFVSHNFIIVSPIEALVWLLLLCVCTQISKCFSFVCSFKCRRCTWKSHRPPTIENNACYIM